MVKTYDTDDDYLHPRRKAVHEISVQGAPILQIFAMEENTDVPDGASLIPASAVPDHLVPGLIATVSVDNKPAEGVAPLERVFIDCADRAYRDRTTELLASGFLRVRIGGRYLFELFSDDGATIWLGGDALISNPSNVTTRREVVLSPGYYPIRVRFRNEVGAACLSFRWRPPDAAVLAQVASPELLHEAGAAGRAVAPP
jgi:hypothetical protein